MAKSPREPDIGHKLVDPVWDAVVEAVKFVADHGGKEVAEWAASGWVGYQVGKGAKWLEGKASDTAENIEKSRKKREKKRKKEGEKREAEKEAKAGEEE